MRRAVDASFLNRVANHPAVRPMLGGDGSAELDLGPLIAEPGTLTLENEWGGFVFACVGPREYEVHSMFLPEGRGSAVFSAAREALATLFEETDCEMVHTQCPDDNPAAFGLARAFGFRTVAPRKSAWRDEGGQGKDMILTRARWETRAHRQERMLAHP